jgi:hypothetical protein
VALARQLNQSVPDIPNLDELKGREALAMLHESIGHLFPGLRRVSGQGPNLMLPAMSSPD